MKAKQEITNKDNINIYNQFLNLVEKKKNDVLLADNTTEEKQKMFSLEAIKRAVKIIVNFKEKITSGKQLKKIPGIGDRIAKRIDEIIETGELAELKNNTDFINTDNLESVYGIGRKTAIDFILNHNIKNANELKKAYESGKIELSNNILKGLQYHDKIEQNIPRTEMLEIDKILHEILNLIDNNLYGLLCGSFRREKIKSNDIDLLFTYNGKKNKINYINVLVNYLIKNNYIIDSFTSIDVPTKYMGLFALPNKPIRRIDIRFVPNDSFYSALLYFTGSADFNKNMRLIAMELGYMLNEYGLHKVNGNKLEKIKINSEKDIFDILELDYVEPRDR